jgi:beta-glucuronidase
MKLAVDALPSDKPYPRFVTRQVESLNGVWDFHFLGDQAISDAEIPSLDFPYRQVVPASFDAMPDTVGQRGLAAYRTRFFLAGGNSGLLDFEGIGFWARVYIDGKAVGGIRHGWTPFEVDVGPSESIERELIVIVDNRFDFQRSPLHEEFFDFHHWGGITRSVWLHEVPKNFIRHVTVCAEESDRMAVDVEMSEGGGNFPSFEIDGHAVLPESCTWKVTTICSAHFTRLQLSQWNPCAPNLHLLRVTIPSDDMVTRFGVRKVEAKEGEIFLNGERIRLFGVNRHESHPQYGSALPLAQLFADLQLIRGLGGNFIRGSHYPQDQRFLDLCDEMGMLVWEEGVGWGQWERQFSEPDFQMEHAAMMKAMMRRSINHPAIVIWGFLNEAATDRPACRTIFEQTVSNIRAMDSTRLVSSATRVPMQDLCYDLVDIVSVNIYPGWYGCQDHPDPLSLICPRIAEILIHLRDSGFSGKPFILSEIGVEALPGWQDSFQGFFTEDYQAKYLEIVVEEFLGNPGIAGLSIWHFSDARTYKGGRSLMRPRAFNNKGIFDEYRRPKRAVEKIRSLINI